MRSHWKRWALGAVAGLAAIFVGGPFIYIHFIEGKAPAPLSLASLPTTTIVSAAPAATSATVDGTWKVANGSEAGYRIKETLFGQSNTAVGRTTAVTGSIMISGATVPSGSFTVDMTQVSSDRSQRDEQFQGRIMDTASHPTATFALTRPIALGSMPADGIQVTETAFGNLTLHGVTKPVSFQVAARCQGNAIQVSGSIAITFADWNISNPSGGPATTADNGILEFALSFSHV
jgi:polyisoprenoid-binding protein YceI